jgi:hypothetical protein
VILPVGQVVHDAAPPSDLYVPTAHAVHPAEFAVVTEPVYPAAQDVQEETATLPVVEVV